MHSHDRATGVGYTFAAGLLLHRKTADGWSLISPVAAGGRSGDKAWVWALAYYGVRGKHSDADVLFPLVWSFRGERSSTTVAGPFYIGHENHETGGHVRIAPPLFWDVKSAHRRFTLAFPFYMRDEEPGLVKTAYGLWPLLFYRTEKGTGDSKHIGRAFMPFYSWRKYRPEDVEWKVLGGLFGFERQGIYRRMILFWIKMPEMKPLDHPVAAKRGPASLAEEAAELAAPRLPSAAARDRLDLGWFGG
jgi:hypothetical protein